jgi:proline dehydrogenase
MNGVGGGVLRRLLLAASDSATLQRLATTSGPARAVARRFVAGEELDEALEVVASLNAAGRSVTLDHLGESVDRIEVAEAARSAYVEALGEIHARRLDCTVSVKLSQLGMALDAGLCHDLVADVAAAAARVGSSVTVDMEGSDTTAATIDLVLALRDQGHANLACAVQAYLHRTPADLARLTAAGVSARICKGAYDEDVDVAWQEDAAISAAFLALAESVLGSDTDPRFATHDHRLVHHIRNAARRRAVGEGTYEFQQLYGVRETLQHELVTQGHRVRVYVPFGQQWYPYLVRRLGERPANLGFFLRALAGSVGGASSAPPPHATSRNGS